MSDNTAPVSASSLKNEEQEETKTSECDGSQTSAVSLLSRNFVDLFEDDLRRLEEKLSDVRKNQNVLSESLLQEKDKMIKNTAVDEIEAAMVQINHYRLKLCHIKKTMVTLKENSYKLRKEALRLQQIKQKENMKREELRHKQLEENRALEARLSPK